jgi:hypothetical protein
MVSGIARHQVSSSSIYEVGYDEKNQVLEVMFTSKAIYQYKNVPKAIYEEFIGAPSLGTYFLNNIRDNNTKYPFERDVTSEKKK